MSGGFGVDSFDSKLPAIRAKGGWLGSQNSKLSVLFVVIDGNNKQYTRSAVGWWAADRSGRSQNVLACATCVRADIRMKDIRVMDRRYVPLTTYVTEDAAVVYHRTTVRTSSYV